jgi:hypothetical protein
MAEIHGDLTVKYFRQRRGWVWPEAAHPECLSIEVRDEDASVWDVVTHSFRYQRGR